MSYTSDTLVALRRQGVPAKMIAYAGQPHGISGHWNNVHRMVNELKWIDAYLKTTPASTGRALNEDRSEIFSSVRDAAAIRSSSAQRPIRTARGP